MNTASPSWLNNAVALIEADYQRSADTHLIPLPLPSFARHGIDLYLKDASTHSTGSLKHRLAHSLAAQTGGHYIDQFTYAERATDWRGNNSIAESMFTQMARERHPIAPQRQRASTPNWPELPWRPA